MSTTYKRLVPEELPELRMVLLGKTGAGKSASGNTILRDENAFRSILCLNSVTSVCQKETKEFDGHRLTVVDTPGLFDTNLTEENMKAEILRSICFADPGPHVFLIVLQPTRFTNEEQQTLTSLWQMFGDKAPNCTMMLFTHGDQLEANNVNIQTFPDENPVLRDFISRCGGGYHVFNNRSKNPSQVRELLKKIKTMIQKNKGSCYTSEMLTEAGRVIQKAETDLRIVLVGKPGAGKSAAGNTILGGTAFRISPSTLSSPRTSSVTSECQKETAHFDFKRLAVVDTPGLFQTRLTRSKLKEEILRFISFAAPGPHVFLVVIQPNMFTTREEETVKIIQEFFGKEAAQYTMALFTCGDQLEADKVTIETRFNQNPALRDFISQCGGGYHVFNNKSTDPTQVRELLKKINMIKKNKGSCYTSEMFTKSERAVKNEMERLQRENPNMAVNEARHRAERKNSFTQDSRFAFVVAIGTATGVGAGVAAGIGIEVAVGGAVGAIGGPVGAAAGAAAGAAIGAGVGLARAAIIMKRKMSHCCTQ